MALKYRKIIFATELENFYFCVEEKEYRIVGIY
jgi:hypothetical protein